MEQWRAFLSKHKGKKHSMSELSDLYRSSKKKKTTERRSVSKKSTPLSKKPLYVCSADTDKCPVERSVAEMPEFIGDDNSGNYLPNIHRTDNCIYFSGDLYQNSCATLKHALRDAIIHCKGNKDSRHIELHVQSHGGSILATMAVIDMITACKIPVHAHVDGYAMSAAAVLVIACTKRFIGRNAVMLLHATRAQINLQLTGTMMQKQLYDVNVLDKACHNIITKRSKTSLTKLKKIEEKEQYLTAAECLKCGFVDHIC